MASERQIAANRRNARKSTGPRTAAGKARASRNAWRHGLAVPLAANAPFAAKIEALARRFAERDDDVAVLTLARAAAEAVLDLDRVRRVRTAVIEAAHRRGADATSTDGATPATAVEVIAAAVRLMLPDLKCLEDYEQRAAARRDRALVALDGLRNGTHPPKPIRAIGRRR